MRGGLGVLEGIGSSFSSSRRPWSKHVFSSESFIVIGFVIVFGKYPGESIVIVGVVDVKDAER